MKKKTIIAVLLIMIMLLPVIGSCAKAGKYGNLFPKTEIADTVYAVDTAQLSVADRRLLTSLQGVVAQDKAAIWIDDGNNKTWREDLSAQYGVHFESVGGVDAVWELVARFKDKIADGGFVTYQFEDKSYNSATSISAATGWLAVEESLAAKARQLGLIQKADGKQYTEQAVFEQYKDKFSKKLLVHVDVHRMEIRDYAIATKAFCFFYKEGTDSVAFMNEVLRFTDGNTPIMGWTDDELGFVTANSKHNKITMAADWCVNLSALAACRTDENLLQDNRNKSEITPEAGKHYVSIVLSDGDNLTWHTGQFTTDHKYYNNKYRGDFPISYGINPAMIDLAPEIIRKEYAAATPNDEFITGVSGAGYINSHDYADMKTFARQTNHYMARCDMNVLNLLDNSVSPDKIKEFAKQPNILGGLWMVGEKYIAGGGGVYFSSGKPFVTFREAMWGEHPVRVAARINSYKRDYTVIEGYTVLVVHAWTSSLYDVKQFVENLDEHVEVVSSEQILKLITKNVRHQNVTLLNDKKTGFVYPAMPEIETFELYHKEASIETDFDFSVDAHGFLSGTFGVGDSAARTAGSWKLSAENTAADSRYNAWIAQKIDAGGSGKMTLTLRSDAGKSAAYKVLAINKKGLSETLCDWTTLSGGGTVQRDIDIARFSGEAVGFAVLFNGTGDGGALYVDRIIFN